MPTTATTRRPAAAELDHLEREVLSAVGCGLRDEEIGAALGLGEDAVAAHLTRILVRLGLRDRAAAIVHAFDAGLVRPGHGPRTRPAPPPPGTASGRGAGPQLRISLLGPVRAWRDGRPLPLGHLRQQSVLAALALCAGRTLGRRQLLDGVWGPEQPDTNVVPVYVYRLRRALLSGPGPERVIAYDRGGYRLVSGAAEVDLVRLEELAAGMGAADRAGEPAEALRLCVRALELFRGEPLAGLPGPLAELERLRLTERQIGLAQRQAEYRLRLGRCPEAVSGLFALLTAHPLHEPAAETLMRALYRAGRQAEALAVFERTRHRLAQDLGVAPGPVLRRTHRMILRGEEPPGPGPTGAAR
ncbi:BTAD domain-containing putative transcriptional regulator [Streptomyces sp. NPDC006687]|uniref:BTAD domain-containing putative transcriptional regulator n=1 Tax=unclassified Streptomyces TaxID=2593676 RepID=UPI0033E2B0D3